MQVHEYFNKFVNHIYIYIYIERERVVIEIEMFYIRPYYKSSIQKTLLFVLLREKIPS